MSLLVVGLGNPGAEYASTRHNLGFMVVDELASRAGSPPWRSKFHGELADGRLAGEPATFLKPLTYMNESGRSVGAALSFFKLPLESLLVIHDDLDVPFPEVRLKSGGGDAGQRGVRSIIAHLGKPDFTRIRLGIGRPPAGFRGSAADFVLQGFAPAERVELAALVARAADAAELIASRGLAAAMNQTHRQKPSG
ncbi:MAG TPA: aminoacyl-tRNA hydrolase [Polyangiaceae bacterium]|jgi:PTH1 family peptidyl-tRNA hydrolase|nr:aminoacyl-tRNA hydrolase [Polyangiaceae bacterium]